MKGAFITGASGFIGGAVVRIFADEGWHVLALVHRRPAPDLERLAAEGRVTIVRGDAADESTFKDALKAALARPGVSLEAVVHAAGRASDVGWRREFRRSHVESAAAMVRLVRELAVPRLVLVSTTDVYGLRDFHGEEEDDLPIGAFPANPYPENKIAAEAVVRRELPPERVAFIRPAFVWGEGDRTLVPRVVAFLRHSPWIVHFGPWRGRNRWPLAHVRNVAMTCFLAATSDRAAGRAVNVLEDEVTSVDEFYRILARLYLPGRRFRTACLPLWIGRIFGAVSSGLSNLLNRDHPFMDPSYYAVYAVSRNLDFGNRRMRELFAEAGRAPVTRAEGIRELETPARPL